MPATRQRDPFLRVLAPGRETNAGLGRRRRRLQVSELASSLADSSDGAVTFKFTVTPTLSRARARASHHHLHDGGGPASTQATSRVTVCRHGRGRLGRCRRNLRAIARTARVRRAACRADESDRDRDRHWHSGWHY